MTREELQCKLDAVENRIWQLKGNIDRLLGKESAKLLARNKRFRDAYKGQTCFILGNGPSLKLETRLEELKDHWVFTVNQMYRSPVFQQVAPQFHVMQDPLFFDLNPEDPADADTLERMQKVASDPDIQMILPVDAKDYVEKHLGKSEKHIFVKGRYRYYTGYRFGYDMAGYIPASRNVVQTAIYCALYMGFRRIVLLGCDMTGLMDNYVKRSPEGDPEKFTHVYEYTQAEKLRMQRVHAEHDNETMLEGFRWMFTHFRVLSQQCQDMGVELMNATQITAIDNLPFVNLNDILDEMKETV